MVKAIHGIGAGTRRRLCSSSSVGMCSSSSNSMPRPSLRSKTGGTSSFDTLASAASGASTVPTAAMFDFFSGGKRKTVTQEIRIGCRSANQPFCRTCSLVHILPGRGLLGGALVTCLYPFCTVIGPIKACLGAQNCAQSLVSCLLPKEVCETVHCQAFYRLG